MMVTKVMQWRIKTQRVDFGTAQGFSSHGMIRTLQESAY